MSQHTRISSLFARLRTPRLIAAALVLGALLATPNPAFAAPLVFIDAGHGGVYNNASAFGLREKTANLGIALALRSELESAGIDVGMTRTTDRQLTTGDVPTWHWNGRTGQWGFYSDGRRMGSPPLDDLQMRCDLANAAGADLFVSIHNNGSRNRRARGTETWSATSDDAARSLNRYVQAAMTQHVRLPSRGSKFTSFYVLRWSNMPAVLVEGGFVTNRTDNRALKRPSVRRLFAHAIASGIQRWLATDPFKRSYPRFGGTTPAEVAAAACVAQFPAEAESILLVSSTDPTSAMTAAPLALRLGAAVLVADAGGVPTATAAQLARLRPSNIIAIASPEALPDGVLAAAAAAAGSAPAARRIAGADACSTAALVADEVGVPTSGRVALASSASFADAISACLVATGAPTPVLLTEPSTVLSPATAAFFAAHATEISQTIVVGDALAVWPSAVAGLPGLTRIGGPDSFRTNVAVLSSGWKTGRIAPSVAPSAPSPSGIIAAAASMRTGQPLLLTGGRVLSPYSRLWMTNRRYRASRWTIVGTDAEQPNIVDSIVNKVTH
ncbi:MAG: N-acetylmuramoyl-L-alanine amidase [Coriobacteriia bacterium]|nr:N-acetylmuramoyl-L-alanine amidase [Coriobacteriia bacterium]